MMKDEAIIVLKSKNLDEVIGTGLCLMSNTMMRIIDKHSKIRPRGVVENNPDFKQIVMYGCLIDKDCTGAWTYQRGKGTGEKRLSGQRSIGFGGHVNSADATLLDALKRELHEEVEIDVDANKWNTSFESYINDNSDDVGRCHLGIVTWLRVGSVKSKENSISDLQFKTWKELEADIEQYEHWSKLLIRDTIRLIKGLPTHIDLDRMREIVQAYDDADYSLTRKHDTLRGN